VNVFPGDYELREVLQGGWMQTHPNPVASPASGDVITDKDFGNYQLGSIGGIKFEDLDGNGFKDAGEEGLDGWTIELIDADTGLVVRSQVTEGGGSYVFGDILDGDYDIREVPQHGWVRTLPGGLVHSITLAYNEDRGGIDFGNQVIPGIHGQKFDDLNANGVRDPGEPGLDGWTIQLIDP